METSMERLFCAEEELHLKVGKIQSEKRENAPLHLEKKGNELTIIYGRDVELFRALSLAKIHETESAFVLEETPRFSSDGVMLDCSRNGVMTLEAVYAFLRKMAYMGLDRLLLYTEDTYTLPKYPYFGYERGGYTVEELKSIDAYAASWGIEVVPCIQTLGHLGNILWWNDFQGIRDSENVLLADEDETYRFIEAEIRECRECFHSSRIHIGMDEAFMMGFGAHYDRHGYENPEAIFIRHLNRVNEICKRYGFAPMIWSDMIFRMSRKGDYYGKDPIHPTFVKGLPTDVRLVYWDYYHESEADYERFISEHQQFANPLSFAGGSWRWVGFTPLIGPSLRRSRYALDACLKKGVKDVLLTGWGDNGNECPFFTMLPAMALYAEYSYEGNDKGLADLLKVTTGETLERMLLLDLPNMPDGNPQHLFGNPSKYLFYQDVIGGLFDRHTDPCYRSHYQDYERKLRKAAKASGQFSIYYQTAADLCTVLSDKSDVGLRLRKAYQVGDKKTLEEITMVELPRIRRNVSRFRNSLEKEWLSECKNEGFDILDGRIGWLLARISTAERRLKAYLKNPEKAIPELAQEALYFDGRKEKGETEIMTWNWWGKNVSTNVIG
jgi:hexosaminidase